MNDKILNYKGIIVSVLCCALMVGDLPPLNRYARAETTAISIQQPLSELSLDASHGKIHKTYLSKETKGHVVLIQNAHAVADAQNSIFNLLEILKSNYGIDLVTVEGASKRLDGLFLKSFPEEETMRHVLNDYLKRGELAGVAASLIKSDDVIFEGIEEQSLYFKNMEVFIRALSKQVAHREEVKKYFKNLDDLKSQYYSRELQRLDSAVLHFKADTIDLMHFLAILQEHASLSEAHEHKNLNDLWQSMETSDSMDMNQKVEEIESLANQISVSLKLHEETKEFYAEKQKFETEAQSAESFLEYLLEVVRKKKIEVKLSSQLRKDFHLYQRIKNLEGEKLYEEIEDFTAKVKQSLIKSAEEKNLNHLTEHLVLLEKNINLELSREDWTKSAEALPQANESLAQDIQEMASSISELNERVQSVESPFRQFYELAIKREKVLFENMKQSLKRHDRQKTAVVLGGFHSEGFQELLKSENFSFHVITPKIEKVEGSQLYLAQMQGQVSWKKFMKEENGQINVHEAFHRAVMQDALKEKGRSTTFHRRGFLKSWRDELIRATVEKGRASKAFEYTHFIDDYFIEELPTIELNELRKNWTDSVEGFTKDLQKLYDRNEFSVSQISQLFKNPALESWITLLPFANESVPARWLVTEDSWAETTTTKAKTQGTSVDNLSRRFEELQAKGDSRRSELRKNIMIAGEQAEMAGGFIVKAPESWSSEEDAFIYRKDKSRPLRVGFKPNYDPLVMDVEDHLRQTGVIEGVNDVLRWSQKVTRPDKAQKVIVAVPTHDSGRGLNLNQKIDYFYELQEQIKKAKQLHPDWDIELVINVNGLNQEPYLKELLNFQRVSDVPTTILSMPFGGQVEDDPSPGKGSAVNFIRQYALDSGADIVGLMDDDVTFLNETFEGEVVEASSHVLSNLEFLIAQTRENRSPVLVGSQYTKEFPETLWRKMVKEPFIRSGLNQIRGISMFTFLDTLPAMPSFPINEDLYLSFYFRDLRESKRSTWRILGNPKAPISFRAAGTFLSDFRQNYRWNLGDLWTFQLMYGDKKDMVHPQFGLTMFRNHYKLIFTPWFWFRKIFVNHLVGAELFLRQTFSRPRLTTRWAESVPEETKQRPAVIGSSSVRSELRAIELGPELTSETSFLSDQEILIFKSVLGFLERAAVWISETKKTANPFDVFTNSKYSIKLRVLKEKDFVAILKEHGVTSNFFSYDSLLTMDVEDAENPNAMIRLTRDLLKPESFSELINALTNTLLIDAAHHFETLEDRIAGTYVAEPFLEEQVRVYKANIEFLENVAQYAEHLANQGTGVEQHRRLAADIRTKEVTKEEKSLKAYLQELHKTDPYRFSQKAVPFVVSFLNKTSVTWATAYPDFPAEAARRELAKLPTLTRREALDMMEGKIDESLMGIPAGQGHKKLTLARASAFAIKNKARIRINGWDYQVRENDILITNAETDEEHVSTDVDFKHWLQLALQAAVFASMVGARQTVANRFHEFSPTTIVTEKERRYVSTINRQTRTVKIANLPRQQAQLQTPKRQALLEAKVAYALAVLSSSDNFEAPILRLPSDDEFFDRSPARSELRSDEELVVTPSRAIQIEFTSDQRLSMTSRKETADLPAKDNPTVVLKGEAGMQAALALSILTGQDPTEILNEYGELEANTQIFLEKLTNFYTKVLIKESEPEDLLVTRLKVDRGFPTDYLAYAIENKKTKKKYLFAINLHGEKGRRHEKTYVRVALPSSWLKENSRSVHRLKDFAPSLYGIKPGSPEYTQVDQEIRVGLLSYSDPVVVADQLPLHLFQVRTKHVPQFDIFINEAKTRESALKEGGFSPAPNRVTHFRANKPIRVHARLHLNGRDGKPLALAPDQVRNLIIAEAEHNFFYDGMRFSDASLVEFQDPKKAAEEGYLFQVDLEPPAEPGMYWVNMRFRLAKDVDAKENIYSLADREYAAIIINIEEEDRAIEGVENRRRLASKDIESHQLSADDELSQKLVEKAKIAKTFQLQDASKGGEFFAASSMTRGYNRSYLYSWIRDGVQDGLHYVGASEDELKALSRNYLEFLFEGYHATGRLSDQRLRRVDGRVLRPITSFNDPQTDGPAHVGRYALEYLRYMESEDYLGTEAQKQLDRQKVEELLQVAVKDLIENAKRTHEFLKEGKLAQDKDPRGYDIWEELYGIHFSNILLNYSFLHDLLLATQNEKNLKISNEVARNLNREIVQDKNASETLRAIALEQFNLSLDQNYVNNHFVSHRKVRNAEKMDREKNRHRLDGQMIWSMLYAKYRPFSFSDPMPLATLNTWSGLYKDRFEFSREIKKRFPHVLPLGRYYGDPYDGISMLEEPFEGENEIAMSGAHFWFITTLWRTQYDLRLADEWFESGQIEIKSQAHLDYLRDLLEVEESLGDLPNLEIGMKMTESDAGFFQVMQAIRNRTNQTLEFVSEYITADRSLYEQFNREDGRAAGTADLNWSNGTFVEAVIQRDRFQKKLNKAFNRESAQGTLKAAESLVLESITVEEYSKIFRPDASTFIWRTSAGSKIAGVSDPGLPGLVEALKALDLRGDVGELSLDYHILQSQSPEGDLFPYILAHLANLPAELQYISRAIEKLKQESISQGDDEKIATNRRAIYYLDEELEKMAGVLFERYLTEKDPTQIKRFAEILKNRDFRNYMVRYLRQAENTEELSVGEEGISFFAIERLGKDYLIPINVDAMAYPDPEDNDIQKARTRVVANEAWEKFLEKINFQENGFIYQTVNVQTGEVYRSYRPLDFKNALELGIPGIQILEVRSQVSNTTLHFSQAIQSPQFVTNDIQNFINKVASTVNSPAALTSLLKEIAGYQKIDAESIYGKDKVSSVMAFVAFLAPTLLDNMKDWNPNTYQHLKRVIEEKPELFAKGQIQFHHSTRKNVLILSRMHNRERMLLGVPFAFDAVSLHDNIPKVWTSFPDFGDLNLQGGSVYRFKDPIAQRTYPLKHFGSDLIERGHSLGIPVVTDKFDTPTPDYPIGFQFLELEHLRLGGNFRPAHDMQVLEINAREFLEVDGEDVAKRLYRSFDDVSDEEIRNWKDSGYNTIWMMGIWVESNASRIINQRYETPEGRGRVASAFSTLDYVLNPRFANQSLFAEYDQAIIEMRNVLTKPGDDSPVVQEKVRRATEIFEEIIKGHEFRESIRESEEAFIRFVNRAKAQGVRILVDFIPNHLSADSPRIAAQPELFVHLNHPPNDDMKDFFYPVDLADGRKIWVAHGKDGTPWADTAQLNLESEATWHFFKETMDNFIKYTDGGGVRIDSLQVLKPEVYWGIWQHQLEAKTLDEFVKKLSDNVEAVFGKRPEFTNNPFEVLHAYAREKARDFKTIGEVYHGQHPHWQNAGVDVTYAKYSYKWLVDQEDQNWHMFKDHVLRRGPHAGLSAQYLYRSSYLLEDHDERKRVLEALMERLGVSIHDEIKKVIDKSGHYRVTASSDDRQRLRQELLNELNIDAEEIIDRALAKGSHYWDMAEGSEERFQAQTDIGIILLEKAITPEIIDWSKLLATMIAVIPGVTLTYDGQEEGKVRLISSADWIPPHTRKNEEPVREELKAFYRELHQKTARNVFRRGEVPVRIPLKGVDGGELPQILAFSRTYGNMEAIVVLNHSREPIDVTLDLTHLGFGEQKVSLAAWGSHIETLVRSELRTSKSAPFEGKKLRDLLFHRRLFDPLLKQELIKLIPAPYLALLESREQSLNQMGLIALGYHEATETGYMMMALHDEPQLHFSVGFPSDDEDVISPEIMEFAITMEDAENDALKIQITNPLPSSQGQDAKYDEDRFKHWFLNQLLPFAKKLNFKAIVLSKDRLTQPKVSKSTLAELGFVKDLSGDFTFPLRISDERSELRSEKDEEILKAFRLAFNGEANLEIKIEKIKDFAVILGTHLRDNRLAKNLPAEPLLMLSVIIEELFHLAEEGRMDNTFGRSAAELTYNSMISYVLQNGSKEIHQQFIEQSSLLQPLLSRLTSKITYRKLLAMGLSFTAAFGDEMAQRDLLELAMFSDYAKEEVTSLESFAELMSLDRRLRPFAKKEAIANLINRGEDLLQLHEEKYMSESHVSDGSLQLERDNYLYELAMTHMRMQTGESFIRAVDLTDRILSDNPKMLSAYFVALQARYAYIEAAKHVPNDRLSSKYKKDFKRLRKSYRALLLENNISKEEAKAWDNFWVAMDHQVDGKRDAAKRTYQAILDAEAKFDLLVPTAINQLALHISEQKITNVREDVNALLGGDLLANYYSFFTLLQSNRRHGDVMEAFSNYFVYNSFQQINEMVRFGTLILQNPELWPESRELLGEIYTFVDHYGKLSSESQALLFSNIVSGRFMEGNADEELWDGVEAIVEASFLHHAVVTRKQLLTALSRREAFSAQGKKLAPRLEELFKQQVATTLENRGPQMRLIFFLGEGVENVEKGLLVHAEEKFIISQMDIAEALFQDAGFDALQAEKKLNELKDEYVRLEHWDNYFPMQMYRIFIRSINTVISESDSRKSNPEIIHSASKFVAGYMKRNQKLMKLIKANGNPMGIYYELGMLADAIEDYELSFDYLSRFFDDVASKVTDKDTQIYKIVSMFLVAVEAMLTASVFMQKDEELFRYSLIFTKELLQDLQAYQESVLDLDDDVAAPLRLAFVVDMLEHFRNIDWGVWFYLQSDSSPLDRLMEFFVPILLQSIHEIEDRTMLMAIMNLAVMLDQQELLKKSTEKYVSFVDPRDIDTDEALRIADLIGLNLANQTVTDEQKEIDLAYIDQILANETENVDQREEYLLYFQARRAFFAQDYEVAISFMEQAREEDQKNKSGVGEHSFSLHLALLHSIGGDAEAAKKFALESLSFQDFEAKKGRSKESTFARFKNFAIFFLTMSRENKRRMIDVFVEIFVTEPLKAFQMDELIRLLGSVDQDYFNETLLKQMKARIPELDQLPQNFTIIFQKIEIPENQRKEAYLMLIDLSQRFEKSAKNIRRLVEKLEKELSAGQLLELSQDAFDDANYQVAARYLGFAEAKRDEALSGLIDEAQARNEGAQKLSKRIKDLQKKRGDAVEITRLARELLILNPKDRNAESLAGLSQQVDVIKKLLLEGEITRAERELRSMVSALNTDDKLAERLQTFEDYKRDLRRVTELLEDHRYQEAEKTLDQALQALAAAWKLEEKIKEKTTLSFRERIAEQLSEVTKHRDDMLANGSLRDVFRHAEDMINFPEHADEVYQHLIEAGQAKFQEALEFRNPHEKAKRESRLKSAFHYGRLVLEVMAERERISFYEQSAKFLTSQAAAQLWLPKLEDDYFMIASMVEAEEKREIIDRKQMGISVDAPLEFSFSDFEVMPDGKSFRLKQFDDKNIYDHLWTGDTFKVELSDGQELQSFFRLMGFTKDFLEFQMPDTPEAKEEVIKILGQVTKQNQGKIIRTRNSSWVIQRDLLFAIVERLMETTRDHLDFDFEKRETTIRQASTGNTLLDKILGLDVGLMPTGEKVFRASQSVALDNLLDQKALEEGYDLDPAQREGIKEVLLGFAPFVFLQGPPGTGKTTATVWQTELLMQLNKHIRILSQTNPGADNVVRRLRGDDREIVRVGNNEEAIDPELLEDWKNRKAALKRLAQAKAQGQSTVIAGTINGLPTDRFMGDHLTLRDADVVETDESSRATVSESILAVSWFNGVKTKVFVGDHIQLPAHGLTDEDVKFAREYLSRKIKGRVRKKGDQGIDARVAGKNMVLSSAFGERNFEDVFARQNVKGFKISLMEEALRLYFPNYEDVLSPENFFTATRPAFFFFDVQRRSGTDIVKLINHFYHGRLKAGRKTRGLVIEDDTQKNFKESRDQQEGDITNPGEIYRIIHWVNDLMNEKGLEAKDIAVISPYKKQVKETDRALLDFATIHSFLEKFNTEGKLDGVQEVVNVLGRSRAIKSWLLEKEIQKMRAQDANFDFQRAKRRADEKLDVLVSQIEAVAANPSPKGIKAWRENFGLGEKFVTLKDIEEFRLRTLTADSSIGQEFKAVILSLVRSNLGTQKGNQGNAGFMADPIDGMRRLNVATSRAQDIFIMIWDRETFTKNKDADVRNWANHTAGVFDVIRKNPVDWEEESIRIEAEALGEDPDEYAPDSSRSELREVVEPALAALALKGRGVADLATQASRQLVAGAEQHALADLLEAMREESQRSRYLRILTQGYDADREEIKRLEIEARIQSKHRRHDLNITEYVTTYLQESGAEFERRLLDSTDSLKRLNFSFAFELDENIETQKMILEYVRRVEKLKALEYTHDVTIKANIRLMVSEGLRKKLSPSFRSAIDSSRVAHFFELKDNALTSIHMDDYLKRNPQALAYLFSDRAKSGQYVEREVHSRFEVANTLPVTLMMTDFMAADEIEELNDDYLIRLPHRLPFPDAVTFNGQNLEVTARALELIYEIQAKQLIATMA